MAERPPLSKGEMEIVRVLWDLRRATVRQVHESFPNDRQIEFATVQTYLRRLEKKGYVRGKLESRTRVYTPRARPRTVIRETVGEFVDRLFGGESLPLVRHLIEEEQLTPEDLQRLREMLDELDDQGRQL